MAKVAALLGAPLMPWQRLVVDTALELDARGRYRYRTVVLTVPRQAGKTTLLGAVLTHRALTLARASLWLSAQTRNDARDIWLRVVEASEASKLAKALSVRRANGSEAIRYARTGSALRIFAPGESAIHGKTTDLVGVDEIWFFNAEQGKALSSAIKPTQVTRPASQTWYVSTAGSARSTWMRPMVDKGRESVEAGARGRVAYFEWSVPDDLDPLDLGNVVAYHPAVGFTIEADALVFDEAEMSAADYARAYANQWVSADSFYLAPTLWERCRTFAAFERNAEISFACEIYPDRSGGVIVAAGRLADGRTAVELVEERSGTAWAAPRLLELIRRHRPAAVVVDAYGPARSVHKALTEQHHTRAPLAALTAADFVQADAEFRDGIVERSIAHRSHDRLDAALKVATTRVVQDQTCIARTGEPGAYPAALVAAILAAYGLAHPPADTPRPEIVSGA
ncbi:terminase family protein [Catenulispora sp. NF23]|uniref:terminase large subunit domain-containing protein n=1 Tax=Catenulispora pinistramenti TaxID=2705254 RepID=UPI001BA87C4F|nr:terminase large subunit [Catenulispora pinistramenti]MBS2533857.1 terminase family protein [Catenulispora pinistramenti]